MKPATRVVAGAVGTALAAAACGPADAPAAQAVTINGAGSSFAAPMYQRWARQYHASVDQKVQISYLSIGSGTGISEFTQGIVDFGATDAPMSAAERYAAQGSRGSVVLHVPLILGAVAVIYNLPGVSHLVLDGRTLAGIYLGTIIKWNDPAIAKLNPGVKLPSASIKPVNRADSSGTSYVFSSFLARASRLWANTIGVSTSPRWPIGTSVTGGGLMAAAVRQGTDSIGFVELSDAAAAKIPYAYLRNPAGQAVAPSSASVEAAASAASFPSDLTRLTFSLVNENAPGAYPLAAPTYVVVPEHPQNPAVATSLKAWLTWCLQPAQQSEASRLTYAPLPTALNALALAAVERISG